jgi:predicted P-loop ATPase
MTQIAIPQDDIEVFLKSKYEFKKNTVTGKVEYRLAVATHSFKELDDYTLNSIKRELKINGHKASKAELSGLLNSTFTPRVDVIQAYFEALSVPNQGIDYIDLLAKTVTTTEQELWRLCFKKWIVASVACAVNPDIVNHQVLVLVGSQGVGKTTWLNKLLPPALKNYMYSGHINPNNKDTLTTLTENLFINLDELGSFRRHDIDSLKELITKPTIQVRRAYATYAENYIRRASFMGSVNHFNFLSDDTGNRRFLPFTATAINYEHNINLDHVYSQAYSLYVSKFKFHFDKQEVATLHEYLQQYIDTSIEQQLVEKWLLKANKEDAEYLATTTEIAQYLKEKDGLQVNNASVQKIGSIVTHLTQF